MVCRSTQLGSRISGRAISCRLIARGVPIRRYSTPAFLSRLGLRPGDKVLDLKDRVRCRGCGARGRAVVSIKWAKSVSWYPPVLPKRNGPMPTHRGLIFDGLSLPGRRGRLQSAVRDRLSSSIGRRWSRGLTF
jgi:hypothetical protein